MGRIYVIDDHSSGDADFYFRYEFATRNMAPFDPLN